MNVINFAQGEMAMFTTYVAWQLMQGGCRSGSPSSSRALAFVGAVAIERIVIRPVERASPLTIVIVTLGLLIPSTG